MCENTDSRCTTTVTVRGTRLAGGSSRFLCLSFFAAAKKVSAAPHRGDANKPLRNQGKANATGVQRTSAAEQTNSSRESQHNGRPNEPSIRRRPSICSRRSCGLHSTGAIGPMLNSIDFAIPSNLCRGRRIVIIRRRHEPLSLSLLQLRHHISARQPRRIRLSKSTRPKRQTKSSNSNSGKQFHDVSPRICKK
jgi:hypothetical protein